MFTEGASSAYHWGEFVGYVLALALSVSIVTFIVQIFLGVAFIIAQPLILAANVLEALSSTDEDE